MVDAITLHEEDDSDSRPPVALMGIEAVSCVAEVVAFDCYYDAQSLYDLHYLTGLHLSMCSGISGLELTYMSAFVFDALDIERRGMVPPPRPLPAPCSFRPPSSPFESDFLCSRRDNEQMLSSFLRRERKCHCFLPRLRVCGSPECTLYGHFHPQTAAIIHSALLSSSDSGRIRSLLDNEKTEKRAGGQNCDGPPLTEAGISSLSCNIARRGECDCLNTREKRGSGRKSGERTMQKKQL